jgi:hypothetical protein
MEGNRNNDLCQIIGHTISQGKGYNTVYQVASVHNQMFCCPPLPEDELKAKVDGIWSKHNDTDIIAQFNQNYAQVLLSGKHVIIRKSDNELIQKSDFLSWHEHDTIEVNDKEISKAKYWLNHKNAERYEKLTFNPTGNTEPGTYNMWKGFAVQPNKFGSCELIKDHIHKNVCQGNDDKYTAIMDWLASIVQQKPEGGPNTALVIVGKKGTGKNVFCEVLRHIVGDNQYCEVQTTEHLLGKFSANSIKNKLVTVADEAFWAGTKSHEGLLKARITNKYLTLEEKFMPQYKIENFNNLIILSNEKWVVPVTADERRFLIVEIGNDKRNNHQYFGNLIKEVNKGGAGAFLFELQNREIQNTQWLRNAPKFDEAFQQLEYSMDLTTRFWWNLISDSLDFDLDNFGANVDKSLIEETYRSFIEAHSNSKPLDNRRFWKETYDIFPELKKDVKVTEGIGRVRKKHLPKQIEMVEQFEKATGFDLSQHKIKQEKAGKALEFSKPPEKRKFEDLV